MEKDGCEVWMLGSEDRKRSRGYAQDLLIQLVKVRVIALALKLACKCWQTPLDQCCPKQEGATLKVAGK